MSDLRVDDVAAAAGGTATNLMSGLAKFWAKYTQSGPTVNDSFNMSSITDTSTGQYDPQLTNNMSNSEYAIVCSPVGNGSGGDLFSIGVVELTQAVGTFEVNYKKTTDNTSVAAGLMDDTSWFTGHGDLA